MPTPNDPVARPAELSRLIMRQTCPPEDTRLFDSLDESDSSSERAARRVDSMTSESVSRPIPPTNAADTQDKVSAYGQERAETDFSRLRDTPSPVSAASEAPEPVDTRGVAQAQSSDEDRILTYPYSTILSPWPKTRFLPNSISSYLRPGARFFGQQESDRQVYEVRVDLQHVDMNESFLCGYLRIQGLTEDHPTLTTYFEGEIIGPKYTFQTKHPEWGSTEKVDMQHWNRFKEWKPLAQAAKNPNFTYKNYALRDHLWMRWKEHFLVPDHRVKTITGASFEGFYYICFNQRTGTIKGIYFHARSEKFQELKLEHVADGGCAPAYEFT